MKLYSMLRTALVACVLGFLALVVPQLASFVAVAGETVATSDVDEAMKVIFGDAPINNVIQDTELLDIFQKGRAKIQTERTTGGRYIENSHMFGPPAGFGTRQEGTYIPEAGNPVFANSRVYLQKYQGTVEMTGDTMRRVKGDRGAFLDWGREALPEMVKVINHNLDRILLGYGAGVRARVNAAVPATTLVVDSPMGLAGFDNAVLQFLEQEFLRAGPNLDGSGLRAGVMQVQSFDFDASAIVVDALATGLADNDYLFGGDSAGNDAGNDPMGLTGLIDSGDIVSELHGIDRTVYSRFQSYVRDLGGATALDETVLLEIDDEAYLRGGAKPDIIVTSRAALRKVWAGAKGDRVLNDPRHYTLGKGRIVVLFGDRDVVLQAVRKMPNKLMFGITTDTLRRFMLNTFEWDDTTGSIWNRVTDAVGRKDAFYAVGNGYLETFCTHPHRSWRAQNWS